MQAVVANAYIMQNKLTNFGFCVSACEMGGPQKVDGQDADS
jgi:hypothetical protein